MKQSSTLVMKTNKTLVMKHCANYTVGYICAGGIIRSDGSSVINEELENKPCFIKKGKECDYFDKFVKPIL